MKLERPHITAFVVVAAIVWWIVLLLQGTSITLEHVKPFGVVVSVLVGFGLLFELVLWRQPFIPRWFVKRPDLRGTWRVELQSSYIRLEKCPREGCDKQLPTGERVPKITCYMGVKQTLSSLQMHLMTPESESVFIADRIRPSPNGDGYQVIGVYTNEPNVHLRHERISEMHQGAIIVETHGLGLRPTTLTAKYWSDRKTIGSMEFTARVDQVFTRFADAHRKFSDHCAYSIGEG